MGRTLDRPDVLVALNVVAIKPLKVIETRSSFFDGERLGAVGPARRGSVPVGPFAMPLLIRQGGSDPLVLPDVWAAYERTRVLRPSSLQSGQG